MKITILLLLVNTSSLIFAKEPEQNQKTDDGSFLVTCNNWPATKSDDKGFFGRMTTTSPDSELCGLIADSSNKKTECKTNLRNYFSIAGNPQSDDIKKFAEYCNTWSSTVDQRINFCPKVLINMRKFCWSIADINKILNGRAGFIRELTIVMKIKPEDWDKIVQVKAIQNNTMKLDQCMQYLSTDEYTPRNTTNLLQILNDTDYAINKDFTNNMGFVKVSVFIEILQQFGDAKLQCDCEKMNILTALYGIEKIKREATDVKTFYEKFLKKICTKNGKQIIPQNYKNLMTVVNQIIKMIENISFEILGDFMLILGPIADKLIVRCDILPRNDPFCENICGSWTVKVIFDFVKNNNENKIDTDKGTLVYKLVENKFTVENLNEFVSVIKKVTKRNDFDIKYALGIFNDLYENNNWKSIESKSENGKVLKEIIELLYTKYPNSENLRNALKNYVKVYGKQEEQNLPNFKNIVKLSESNNYNFNQLEQCMKAARTLCDQFKIVINNKSYDSYKLCQDDYKNDFEKFYGISRYNQFVVHVYNDIREVIIDRPTTDTVNQFCTKSPSVLKLSEFIRSAYKVTDFEEGTQVDGINFTNFYEIRRKNHKEKKNVIFPPSMKALFDQGKN